MVSDYLFSSPKTDDFSEFKTDVPFTNNLYDERCFLNALSTHFLICTEKTTGKGEDSGLEMYNVKAGICSVCDGCGGSGFMLRSYATDAYLASRATQNACKLWFQHNCEYNSQWDIDFLKKLVTSNLKICRKYLGEGSLRVSGSLVRTLPTTLAAIVCWIKQGNLFTKHIWAGDSRNYLLDQNGLGQITIDDSNCQDAMENLTRDAALTNIISADKEFTIHSRTIEFSQPCILFSASDGCFAYLSSPMAFELVLLKTLIQAENVVAWESSLREEISERAGDDQTMALAAFGFSSFANMKSYYFERYQYMSTLMESCDSFSAPYQWNTVWQEYKPNYYRFIPELVGNDAQY